MSKQWSNVRTYHVRSEVGHQAVPTALRLGDIRAPNLIRDHYAVWTSSEDREICRHIADEFDFVGGAYDDFIGSMLLGRRPWSARATKQGERPSKGKRLHQATLRLAALGIVRHGLFEELTIYGPDPKVNEQDCVVAMTRSTFPTWQRLETSNKRVIAAFKVAEDQALSFFRAGPLVRVDLWRGELRPLAHDDRLAALNLDELVDFAQARFAVN